VGTKKYELGIVLPDMHLPFEDAQTIRAVERYIADEKWDFYVNLGDFLDLNCVSSFAEKRPGEKEGQRLVDDFVYASAFLDRHLECVRGRNRSCRVTFLEGNHEERIERYGNLHTELKGLADVPRNLDFKTRGIKWVQSDSKGRLHREGKAFFLHGMYASVYHARRHADRFGVPVYYGHTHDVSEFSRVLYGADKTIEAKSLGCLCSYDLTYLKGRPTNWQQAFGVFWVLPDGYFQEVTVRIFKHRFVGPTNGKVYDGRC